MDRVVVPAWSCVRRKSQKSAFHKRCFRRHCKSGVVALHRRRQKDHQVQGQLELSETWKKAKWAATELSG